MPLLNTPLEAGRVKLKNRLVFPPMATAKSERGEVGPDLLRYYDEKSKGGHFGLVIIEHSYIAPEGRASAGQLSVAEDRLVDGLKTLAEAIHANGSKTAMQINHCGGGISPEVTGIDGFAPSSVSNPAREGPLPIALDQDGIRKIIQQFSLAALRVKAAGFDAVEIHSAHGYLLNQFLSPLTNQRADEYGGSLQNRIRIHLEVVKAVRDAVGEAYPVFLRLGAADYMEGGQTPEESASAARELERAGVDLIDISGGMCRYFNPFTKAPGYFASASRVVNGAVSVPVLVTGGITRPEEAEEILRKGDTDLVGVGRAAAKDSDWGRKAMEALSGK